MGIIAVVAASLGIGGLSETVYKAEECLACGQHFMCLGIATIPQIVKPPLIA